MSNIYQVYEGRRYSPVFWEAVKEWRQLCRNEGIPFVITQGGFNAGVVSASASTHDGDAIDISARNITEKQAGRLVYLGRMVGIANWFRTTKTPKWGTRAQGFGSYHFHGVPNGFGHPSASAARQATSYRAGRDGLASNQRDIGPGHTSDFRLRTWAIYNASKKPTPPKIGDIMSEEMVRKVVREEVDRFFNTPRQAAGKNVGLAQHLLTDVVLGEARSLAIAELRSQLRAVANELGVKITSTKAAIVSEINKELDDSIHEAIAEHFPSIEQAQADEIAHTFFELLVEQIKK